MRRDDAPQRARRHLATDARGRHTVPAFTRRLLHRAAHVHACDCAPRGQLHRTYDKVTDSNGRQSRPLPTPVFTARAACRCAVRLRARSCRCAQLREQRLVLSPPDMEVVRRRGHVLKQNVALCGRAASASHHLGNANARPHPPSWRCAGHTCRKGARAAVAHHHRQCLTVGAAQAGGRGGLGGAMPAPTFNGRDLRSAMNDRAGDHLGPPPGFGPCVNARSHMLARQRAGSQCAAWPWRLRKPRLTSPSVWAGRGARHSGGQVGRRAGRREEAGGQAEGRNGERAEGMTAWRAETRELLALRILSATVNSGQPPPSLANHSAFQHLHSASCLVAGINAPATCLYLITFLLLYRTGILASSIYLPSRAPPSALSFMPACLFSCLGVPAGPLAPALPPVAHVLKHQHWASVKPRGATHAAAYFRHLHYQASSC